MKNIAQKLLDGSRKIDQMKIEVNQVVTMIVGLLNVSGVWGSDRSNASLEFPSKTCTWKVDIQKTENDVHLFVECSANGFTELLPAYFYNTFGKAKATFTSASKVTSVHKGLPAFVEGMIKAVPVLKDALEPFIKASE